MKKLRLFVGKLGSGKSFIAKQQYELAQELGENPSYIEVSDLVTEFARKLTGKDEPSREDLQAVKQHMKDNKNWLLDSIVEAIENAPSNVIYLSGLREGWILDKLEELYGEADITVVEADSELRRKRRDLSEDDFEEASKRDDLIGLGDLLKNVKDRASVVVNNYEYES